jgi:hypothetical protein
MNSRCPTFEAFSPNLSGKVHGVVLLRRACQTLIEAYGNITGS